MSYVFRDWVIKSFNDDMPYGDFLKAQLAGDLMDPKVREKTVPGTAILGQGPWWWDQAEPVQGRADERNERIDMVTRGMLGLTVACARCHDHKYDPISQKDYYSLAAVFLNTTYHEYPSASPAEMAVWEKEQKVIDDKEEVLDSFMGRQSELYSEMLAQKTAKYMIAAWQVTGEPKKKIAEAAVDQKVDPEMLERWIKFLAKPPKHYSYLRDWQDMVKCGGTLEQAQFLADNFQKLVFAVAREAAALKEENDIIKAKAGVRKKPRRDSYPNEFETNDQFCPGCDLELKTMPIERTNLYLDVYKFDQDSESDTRPDPGLLSLRDWALERHFSAETTEHVATLRAEIEALKKAQAPYPFLHGASDTKTMQEMHVNVRGNPHTPGDPVPERFLSVLSPPDAKPFSKGSGAAGAGRRHSSQPAGGARDGQPRVEMALRVRHRGNAGQLWQDGRPAFRSGTAGLSGRQFREERHVDQETAARDSALVDLSTQHGRVGRERREGWRQPAVLARESAAAGCRGHPRFATLRRGIPGSEEGQRTIHRFCRRQQSPHRVLQG